LTPTSTGSPSPSPSSSPTPTPSASAILQPSIIAFGYNQGLEIWSNDIGLTYSQKNPGTNAWYDAVYDSYHLATLIIAGEMFNLDILMAEFLLF
jgi:hypothetical protein